MCWGFSKESLRKLCCPGTMAPTSYTPRNSAARLMKIDLVFHFFVFQLNERKSFVPPLQNLVRVCIPVRLSVCLRRVYFMFDVLRLHLI